MSKPKTKQPTRDRILESGVKHAKKDGMEGVTHKVIAGDLGISGSNVGYYYRSADDLRRAVALKLMDGDALPHWGYVEFYVYHQLPEDHSQHPGPHEEPEELDLENLVICEAYLWLARNGVTGDE